MSNIENMNKLLTLDEFSEAKALYHRCVDIGMTPVRATALCYRAGKTKAKEDGKKAVSEAYKKLQEVKKENEILKKQLSEFLVSKESDEK